MVVKGGGRLAPVHDLSPHAHDFMSSGRLLEQGTACFKSTSRSTPNSALGRYVSPPATQTAEKGEKKRCKKQVSEDSYCRKDSIYTEEEVLRTVFPLPVSANK